MKRRGRNLAALAGLAALGVMGRRGTDLGPLPEDVDPEELRAPYFQAEESEYRPVHPAEMRRARKRVLEKEIPGAVLSSDAYPVTSGSGMPIRSAQYKKGGEVKSKAKGRGDGICQRGHTKGRMV